MSLGALPLGSAPPGAQSATPAQPAPAAPVLIAAAPTVNGTTATLSVTLTF